MPTFVDSDAGAPKCAPATGSVIAFGGVRPRKVRGFRNLPNRSVPQEIAQEPCRPEILTRLVGQPTQQRLHLRIVTGLFLGVARQIQSLFLLTQPFIKTRQLNDCRQVVWVNRPDALIDIARLVDEFFNIEQRSDFSHAVLFEAAAILGKGDAALIGVAGFAEVGGERRQVLKCDVG